MGGRGDASLVGADPDRSSRRGRVPVHAPWQQDVGPMLSLGMLTAAARAHRDGALEARYEIHRPALGAPVVADLAAGTGPAVLLASNYIWSLDHNIDLARRAREVRPELLVIHGGPSTPKYHGDAEAFLRTHHEVAHILVHGEGEATLCELLEVLAEREWALDALALARVAGISFLDPATDQVIHTDDRPRIASLDELPSPYLTGEFDDIAPEAWHFCASIETNRGCPYGCTFCDWGSATMARIRKFDLARVDAEVAWCARRGIFGIQLCDANFGILARDVDVARSVASARRAHGAPTLLTFTPAKNTTRHLTTIFDVLLDADVLLSTAISLQTTDPTTLELVERSNISTDAYLALAADLRRRGQPLQGDVLIGMPGQTYESYRADLQFFMDHDISPRTWSLRLLPNAPMNEPGYRERHQIEVDEHDLVVATTSMSRSDRERMLELRKAQHIAWRYGTVRHVMHVLQWDHDIAATRVLEAIVDACRERPTRYPSLCWTFEHFDLFQVPAMGWGAFYDDLARLISERLLPGPSAGVDVALAVQRALMPAPGRTFPEVVALAHDYPSYLHEASRPLYGSGAAGQPERRLEDHPPATLTVEGDPEGLCETGIHLRGDPRSDLISGDFWIGSWLRYELPSDPPIPAAATPLRDQAATPVDLAVRPVG